MTPTSRLMVLALAVCLSPSAFAQSAPATATQGYCDPEVARKLAESYKARQDDLDQSKDGLFKEIKNVADQSIADLSSCVDMSWPTMKIQYPTMDQIIKGVAQELVKRACGEARNKISEQTSHFSQSYYLNTRIPGVPSYGISSHAGDGGLQVGNSAAQRVPSSNPTNPTGGLYGGGNPPKP